MNKFTTERFKNRLGYYTVNEKKFYNKTLALIESRKCQKPVYWTFNDDVYQTINWTRPIDVSLPELYRRRAEQLRRDYDYLVLYFSGGADSVNILDAFISNDIFLDEIVMQMPKPFEHAVNDTDHSMANIYSELEFSAVPILNAWRNKINPNTKIRYQDFSKPLIEVLSKDNWFELHPMGTNICVTGIGRQAAYYSEELILDLCYQGKHTAQILGVDKPLVWYNGRHYFAYFSDLSAHHSPPLDMTKEDIYNNYYHTEFFYWTPDCPEIVIKQAQEIKKQCELNLSIKNCATDSMRVHIGKFKDLLHPIIYPKHVNDIIVFQTDKPSSKVIRPMDEWFWATADKKIQNNYLETIKYLGNNIDPAHCISNDINNGFHAHLSKAYQL